MTTRTDTLKVVYVVDGKANVVGSFQAVGREADALEKKVTGSAERMSKAGLLIGTAIGTGLTAAVTGLGIYIRNTIEAEKVQAQLQARITDTGNAAGRTMEQLAAQAESLQKITIFDDNAVAGAQAALMVFRDIAGTNFDRAVEASADLATKWGTDMPTAAERLGTALQNPERGLRSLASAGVSFSTEQQKAIKAMVESGDKAGAMAIILDQLQGSIGTAAEAAGNTLAGAFTRLKNAAASALQGDSGSEGMLGLRNGVEGLITTLSDQRTKDAFDSVAEGMLGIANAAVQTIPLLVEFWEKAQRVTTRLAGGTGDVTDLKQIRYEIQQNEKELQDYNDASGVAKFLIPDSTVERARDRLKELKDLEQMSLMLFGDPDKPKIHWIDPTDPSTMTEDRHLRPKTSGVTLPPVPTSGKRRPDEKDKEWEEWVKDMDALERVWLQTSTEHNNEANKAANERAAAIERGRAQTDALIADMEQELSLIGATAEERERAIALRYADADATDEQRARIAQLAEEMVRAREAQAVVDDIKGTIVNFAVSAGSGFSSVGDSFEGMADRMKRIAIQLLAEKAIQWLFGMFMGSRMSVADNGSAGFASYGTGGDGGTAFGPYSFSGGGHVLGPGTSTSDSIPARLSDGEFVVKAAAVKRYGAGMLHDINAMRFAAGGGVGSAAGGGGAGSGAGTVVQVFNNTTATARTERSKTPEGGDLIKVIIDQAVGKVNEQIMQQGGSTGRVIASTFGLSRSGTSVSG